MNFPILAVAVLGTAGLSVALARWTRQYALCAVAGAALILYVHSLLYFHYTSDDAYISYRYARNLADGLGLVWNPGEHVEGYSDFLWVGILAGMHRLGTDIVLSGRWLGFGLAVIAAGGSYLLARDVVDGTPGKVAGLFAALLLAASGPWALWATAGLEAPLFAVLTLGATLLHLREREGLRPPTSGVLWAFVAMTRPEGPALFAVSAAFKAGDAGLRLWPRPQRPSRRDLLREAGWLFVWAGGFAAIYVPYFAWRYATYGYIFPNAYYAKVGSGLDQYDRGLQYLSMFSREYGAWLLLLVPLAVAFTRIRRGPVLYVLALVAAWTAMIVYVGGDSLLRFRLFAPVLPLFYPLIVASGAALLGIVEPPRELAMQRAAIVGLAGVALIGFTLQASSNGSSALGANIERQAVTNRAEIGRWLRGHVPDTTTIAVVPAGAIPYESRLTTIDMLGINDEHIAHRPLKLGNFAAGHEKYDTEYVLDRRPDIIILFDGLSAVPWKRADYAGLSTVIIPGVADMVTNPRLFQEYELRAVEIEEGKWFNLLVRQGASDVLVQTQPVSG